ncbi:diguanylate cyclase [Sphingobacterium sp. SRCM116780]|uniref:helix-turn-helix transcriptional regulator n=1 Tax=Sphingobacterium sp. SRCM116780 TaxID=2907623 RepID=UPI001F1C795E|nr:diguanylate cyclase [Sphingobacterium sp. SRCM116780]UIR56987.1 diguanylate cyclase [Sphingobacterium sp. SRCM116780]
MKSIVKKRWDQICNNHISKEMNKLESIQMRITNQYVFLISIILFMNSIRYIWFGLTINFYVLFSLSYIFFGLFLFKNLRFSPYILLTCCLLLTLLVFYFSSVGNFGNGVVLYYFALLSAVFFIFNDKKTIPFSIIIYLVVFFLFYFSHEYDFKIFKIQKRDDILFSKNQRLITFVQVFIIMTLNGYFAIKKNNMITELHLQVLRGESLISDLRKEFASENLINIDNIVKLAIGDNITFIPLFKQVFHQFYDNLILINPQMTNDEFKLCALLKLGFTTKDIANCSHISIRTVQTKKSRLRKSFNILSNTDLYIWIGKV